MGLARKIYGLPHLWEIVLGLLLVGGFATWIISPRARGVDAADDLYWAMTPIIGCGLLVALLAGGKRGWKNWLLMLTFAALHAVFFRILLRMPPYATTHDALMFVCLEAAAFAWLNSRLRGAHDLIVECIMEPWIRNARRRRI